MTNEAAMAAFVFPCAICSSVSRSRGVSSSSGELFAERAPTSASTTFGSTTEPPPATVRIAAGISPASLTRSLSR